MSEENKDPKNDPHYEQWTRLYNEWIQLPDDVSQYKARAVQGLIDGTTYDY